MTPPEAPKITFFGVENPDDEASTLSVEKLTRPLAEAITSVRPDWRVETILRRDAIKARLVDVLAQDPPRTLFTASHAVRFGPDNDRQPTYQGALLCADWPGPKVWEQCEGPIHDAHLFAAPDVGETRLDGLVAFHFACYTAGTPRLDLFSKEEEVIAAHRPFVSSLPKRLLRQGALAVVGHVDVALQHGFLRHDDSQLEIFGSTLQAIMAGHPVGHAITHQYGARLSELNLHLLRALSAGQDAEDPEADLNRFNLWAAYHDVRHFLTLGDPAARLKGCRGSGSRLREAMQGGQITEPSGLPGLSQESSPGENGQETNDQKLYFNGIDGESGEYLLKPRPIEEFEQLLHRSGLRPPGFPK